MPMIVRYRIETFCGMAWHGAGFTYEDLDALEFMTADEALSEIEKLGLVDVYAERFERYSARAPKIYAATEARTAA